MEEFINIINFMNFRYYKNYYINEIYKRLYNKYNTCKTLIINFSFIIIFSLILKNYFKITDIKTEQINNTTNIFNINYIIIKNNTFINQFESNNNKYVTVNNNIKNKTINNNLNNSKLSNYIYNLINKKNRINNQDFTNKTEIMNNNEKIQSFMSNKIEFLKENESLSFNEIQLEIKNYKNNKFNISFNKKEDFYERINPKVSIIITIYNQKHYINTIYACIQNQSLKDIEIIFVDDCSIDNSTNQINLLMKEDKRIIYIKNDLNKGQFYSRYRGIKIAKGEYILVIDPDDLLLNNILIKAYELAKHFDLDIVQYYHIKGKLNESVVRKMNISGIYYYPYIKDIFFNCSYRYLWDKLIKRTIFIDSIGFIKEKYRNTRIIIHNDEVACYGVFRVAKSYGILEQIGYFYNRDNPNSITKFNFKKKNINGRFQTLFTIMDFYYEQSDNNTFDKTMGGYNFFELRVNHIYNTKIKYLTSGFDYINKVLDLYLNSPFFNKSQKNSLQLFKIKINNQKNQINKFFQ